MARVGELHRLFRTFLNLKTTCKKASLSLYSGGRGDCHVTLKVTDPGHGYQTPRRGSGPSRSQEVAPGTLAPSSPPAAPPAAAAAATAPAPARRARRRGPGALLRDERRKLARIEPNLLFPDCLPRWFTKMDLKVGPVFRPPAEVSTMPPPPTEACTTPSTLPPQHPIYRDDLHAHSFELGWELCWDPFCPIGATDHHEHHAPPPCW